jgi:hypothetical protein
MRTLSKILVAAAVAALAAPALASAAPSATGTRGIVVQRDARAGVVVVATPSGSLLRVHVAKPMRLVMGTVVKVRGSKVAVVGRAHKAKLRGVVMRRHKHSFALADHGSVVAVTSPTPPAAGQAVTATVQVTPTELDDDDGDEQVNNPQVAGAEIRGSVISQDANFLRLMVPGFPLTGLAIGITGQTIPVLNPGTQVEARVALGPDPGNANGILLTLVSLHVEGNNHQGEHGHGPFVKAEGIVMDVTEAGPLGKEPGSITILDEHGPVTFVIPAGFGPTGVVKGDEVKAKGTAATTVGGQPTLVRLKLHGDNNDDNNDDNDDGDHHNTGTTGTTGATGPIGGDESGGGHDGGDD